jgi:methyl-accepting chemotaxis protein
MNEIRDAIQNIAEATQNTASNSGNVMDSVEGLSQTVIDINGMSDKQNDIAKMLSKVVKQFKLHGDMG